MTENTTFKVKTDDEFKAEFDTYQKKFDDEYKARTHEIAKTFKNFMYLFPKQTEWWPEIPADCNDNIKSHLKTLFKNAGFVIEFGRTHAIIICK